MHIPLWQLVGTTHNGALHQRIGHGGKSNGGGGDVEAAIQADPTLEIKGVEEGDDEERNDEEGEANVDPHIGVGLVAVEDYEGDPHEADQHVNDGEDAVNAGIGVEIGEVINGSDESVPWEKVTETQGKIHNVG